MPVPEQVAGTDLPTADAFVRSVLRSGLLEMPQLQPLLDGLPPDVRSDAKALSEHLIKMGKLTRFQAGKLLQGITLGLVLGPYHVLSPIGKGGMGAVYLARDSRNQALVALKVLPPKRAKASERLLARFRREMEISQRVNHPHLTRTLEAGTHQDVHFIAMEYIPGKNLHKLVHEEGPLQVPRAARLFAEVCLGLESAHRMGLIHRDLKPSNIMITPDDHAKVLDLGLALIQGESETDRTITGGQGYVVGTMDFLAPEQAEDPLKVDARSDIYSLGCTLYYSLTGKTPFPGGNALQKMLRHKCDPPKPVNELNPTVPPRFAALLTRMIAKRPDLRFSSAADLRQALLPWAEPEPKPAAAKAPVAEPATASWLPRDDGARPAVPPAEMGATPVPVASPAPTAAPMALLLPAGMPLPDVPVPQAVPLAPEPTLGAVSPASAINPPAESSPALPKAMPLAGPGPGAPTPPAAAAASVGPGVRGPAALPAAAAGSAAAVGPAAEAPATSPARTGPTPPASPQTAKLAAVPPPAAAAAPEPAMPGVPKPEVPVAEAADGSQLPAGQTRPLAEAVDELPFWLDFGLPVGVGTMFLAILWIIGMIVLWRR